MEKAEVQGRFDGPQDFSAKGMQWAKWLFTVTLDPASVEVPVKRHG